MQQSQTLFPEALPLSVRLQGSAAHPAERNLVGYRSSWRTFGGLAAALLAACFAFIATAQAQTNARIYSSYVTPFPDRGVYKVMVVGDSLGEGLYMGLSNSFKGDRSIALRNKAKWGAGFSRRVFIGREREFAPLLAKYKPDIVVIAVGAKDALASIRVDRNKYSFGSPEWGEIYKERVNSFIRALKKQQVSVYWVGLPIMKDAQFNENMNTLNEIFREKAHVNSIRFIDSWNGFVDQYGNFSLYGPDLDGRSVRLRDKDGIRFTRKGYDKLAHYVEREIRRDMLAARSERNVPLAGAPEEQSEINNKSSKPKKKMAGMDGGKGKPKTRKVAVRASSSAAAFGEMIASDRASGLTLLSSVTRANDPSLSGGRHSLPLTLRPYYRVLVKGEALTAKPGRSDDFAWHPKPQKTTTQ